MRRLQSLFENNARWAKDIKARQPDFFAQLSKQQIPEYLWIGCSDSRVPANEILGLMPGDIFVHRNVANIVNHTDLNCLSVLQYAVEILKVKRVIVTGHYGCGGVKVAMENTQLGLIDYWLRSIKDVYALHRAEIDAIAEPNQRVDRLCELNVQEQVRNVVHTPIVQNAWRNGQDLSVHACIYSIEDGILHALGEAINGPEQIDSIYRLIP